MSTVLTLLVSLPGSRKLQQLAGLPVQVDQRNAYAAGRCPTGVAIAEPFFKQPEQGRRRQVAVVQTNFKALQLSWPAELFYKSLSARTIERNFKVTGSPNVRTGSRPVLLLQLRPAKLLCCNVACCPACGCYKAPDRIAVLCCRKVLQIKHVKKRSCTLASADEASISKVTAAVSGRGVRLESMCHATVRRTRCSTSRAGSLSCCGKSQITLTITLR